MMDAFRKTMRSEGIGAFFKGFGAVAAMTMPAHAMYFGSYEASKTFFQPSKSMDQKSPWVHFSSGFIADICGSIIWAPMDVIKQRVQMAKGSKQGFENSFKAFQTICKTDGPLGLYRGAAVAIATFGPYVGLYFSFYEHLKSIVIPTKAKYHIPELPINLLCAFSAASLAALITCPIDVVKTNMQVYSIQDGGSINTLDAIKTLYRNGGIRAFLRGWNARILWLAPGTAITMAAYEQCKSAVSFITES
jgi:solute carrier family 25 iron transporter 28/37